MNEHTLGVRSIHTWLTCRRAAATTLTLDRYARPLRAAAPGGLPPTRCSDGMLMPVEQGSQRS